MGGPRESPTTGFQSFAAQEGGSKLRIRSETFADHYSQARQFFISQTGIEQTHIANALTFELSKVQNLAIRVRMVSHLLNIDADLAAKVGAGLRLKDMPDPAKAARPTLEDLKPSPALSILKNGPESFAGRKVGALVTDGVDAKILSALTRELEAEGAMLKLIAPEIGGVEASDKSWHDAAEKLEGGPSVLFDAIAILPSAEGAETLALLPAAKDFLNDAVAHRKFIAYTPTAEPLLTKAGIGADVDDGFVLLKSVADCKTFVAKCRQLRFWPRKNAER